MRSDVLGAMEKGLVDMIERWSGVYTTYLLIYSEVQMIECVAPLAL